MGPVHHAEKKLIFIVLAVLCVAGCSSAATRLSGIPPEPPRPAASGADGKTGPSYSVKGRTYYPLLSARGYEERGIASWYGPSFHGRKTACGQTYNMYKVSAAHKILPMHTRITVTNLENNKSISLVVNDRGPFVSGRVLDLSYGAAKRLAMVDKGLARVVIRTAGKVKGQRNNDLVGKFFVHIGAFERKSEAGGLVRDMKLLRYRPSMIRIVKDENRDETCWRVAFGPFKSMSDANRAHSILLRDYPSAFVAAN